MVAFVVPLSRWVLLGSARHSFFVQRAWSVPQVGQAQRNGGAAHIPFADSHLLAGAMILFGM